MIKCSDVEILLIVGILMFSLVNSTIACTLAWILAGLVIIALCFVGIGFFILLWALLKRKKQINMYNKMSSLLGSIVK